MDGENEHGGVEVTFGFPGASAGLTRAERLRRRGALDAEDAERALTHVVAYLSGLEVDATLFRHDCPAERLDAASVRLTGERDESSTEYRSFVALFAGRELAPGTVTAGTLAALGKLPLRWITASGGSLAAPVTAAEIELLRPARFGGAVVNGRRVGTFEAELGVRICTSPPRGIGATS